MTKNWRLKKNGFFRFYETDFVLLFFLICTMIPFSLQSEKMWEASASFLHAWVITPTCQLLIQANLKCQISPLAFKLTNSSPIIGIFNFIPLGPLYLQSYKYISGILKWVPNSPQNHFFWICASRSHQILAQILFLTDLIITLSQLFQNIITFIKRHITI